MKITLQNYEAFILDYYENNLNAEQVAELLIFLENHPALKTEFEDFEHISITPEAAITFETKNKLKKPVFLPYKEISSENYENYILADLENEITSQERYDLNEFIALNPEVKKEYEIYRHTYLKPDYRIKFANKKQLKKGLSAHKAGKVYRLAFITSLAASIAVLVTVVFNTPSSVEQATQTAYRKIEYKAKHFANNNINIDNSNTQTNHSSKVMNTDAKAKNTYSLSKAEPLFVNTIETEYTSYPDMECQYAHTDMIDFSYWLEEKEELMAMGQEQEEGMEKVQLFLVDRVKKIFYPQQKSDESLRINGWDIADAGVEGFNKITKSEFDLERNKAEDGSVQSLTFTANNFKITRNLKNKKNKE